MSLIPKGRTLEEGQIVHPLSDREAPEGMDPIVSNVWIDRTRWVISFLARPRLWEQLAARSKQEGVQEAMLRQLVAVLEETGEAETVRHGRRTFWRRRIPREREWAIPLPDEDEKK